MFAGRLSGTAWAYRHRQPCRTTSAIGIGPPSRRGPASAPPAPAREGSRCAAPTDPL